MTTRGLIVNGLFLDVPLAQMGTRNPNVIIRLTKRTFEITFGFLNTTLSKLMAPIQGKVCIMKPVVSEDKVPS